MADVRRWNRQKAYSLVAALVVSILTYVALGSPVMEALTKGPPVGVLLLLTGITWLLVEVLIVWTSESPYHEFRRRGGAYVPAGRLEEGLVPGLSLAEHMALTSPKKGFMVDWQQARQEMEARIKRFNIIGQPETPVDALSGGNQQRSMLALLRSPLKLMLLEHPTRGLDATSANWIWELFRVRREDGTTIIFMSADLDELLERSDRIVVFSGGVMSPPVYARDTNVDELGHLVGGKHES
jgi:simple sugar transport system ATP-binding protein